MAARWIFAACAAWAAIAPFASTAAPVPQNSADKYFFTFPDRPAGIKGIVMGDPPAYSVMRSEDVSWIEEAIAERQQLQSGWTGSRRRVLDVPEFGEWPLSATNGFKKWTTALFYDGGTFHTNIIARYKTTTNELAKLLPAIKSGDIRNPDHFYLDDWLSVNDGDYATFNSIDAGEDAVASGFPYITNVVNSVTTNWTGHYYDAQGHLQLSIRTNITQITMAMTNGTISVHTNSWIERLPHVEYHTTTNIRQLGFSDLVFAGSRIVRPEYPSGYVEDVGGGGPFRSAIILQWYKILRLQKRCLIYGYLATQGRTFYQSTFWNTSWDDPEITISTNNVSVSFGGIKSLSRRIYDDESGYGALNIQVPVGSVKYTMSFASTNAVLAGGHNRIKSITAYGTFECHSVKTQFGEGESEYRHARCVSKIGNLSMEGFADGEAIWAINVDAEALIDSAMASTVGSFPSAETYPSSPSAESYSGTLVGAIFVMEIDPWTKFW